MPWAFESKLSIFAMISQIRLFSTLYHILFERRLPASRKISQECNERSRMKWRVDAVMRKEKLLKAFKVTLLADGARSSVRIEHRREDEEGLPDEAFNPRVGGSIPPGPANQHLRMKNILAILSPF